MLTRPAPVACVFSCLAKKPSKISLQKTPIYMSFSQSLAAWPKTLVGLNGFAVADRSQGGSIEAIYSRAGGMCRLVPRMKEDLDDAAPRPCPKSNGWKPKSASPFFHGRIT
jgi:hypothetical protein